MGEVPGCREVDCPSGEACEYACDLHYETDDHFWARLLGDDDPCAPGKDWAAAAFTEGPINL